MGRCDVWPVDMQCLEGPAASEWCALFLCGLHVTESVAARASCHLSGPVYQGYTSCREWPVPCFLGGPTKKTNAGRRMCACMQSKAFSLLCSLQFPVGLAPSVCVCACQQVSQLTRAASAQVVQPGRTACCLATWHEDTDCQCGAAGGPCLLQQCSALTYAAGLGVVCPCFVHYVVRPVPDCCQALSIHAPAGSALCLRGLCVGGFEHVFWAARPLPV